MSRKLTRISGAGCLVLCPVIGLLLAASSIVKADDKATRDRKVRVAVAIAEAEAVNQSTLGVAVAPTPRPVTPKDYAVGRKEALLDQSPLVVYVTSDGPKVEGAITCFVPAPTFGDVAGPAIVVGYPSGDRLLIEKTLPCPAPDGAVKKAVTAAMRKIETPPKQMPPTPTANYRIDASGGERCSCGGGCKCKTGDCPSKCPIATVQPAVAAASAVVPASTCRVEYFYGLTVVSISGRCAP